MTTLEAIPQFSAMIMGLRECSSIEEYHEWKRGQVGNFRSLPPTLQAAFKECSKDRFDELAGEAANAMIGA